MIDYIIIGILLQKPLTGYDIKKEIKLGIGNFYKASYGSLYPALKKLTDKGHLVLTEQTQAARLKKYYKATDLGRDVFMQWLASPVDINLGTAAMLARIYFFGELPKDIRNQRLQEYEAAMQKILTAHEQIEQQFAHTISNDRQYFELSTLFYGLQSVQGMIRWVRHIQAQKEFPVKEDENA